MLFITLSTRIYQTVEAHTKLKKRGVFKKNKGLSFLLC